jgi:hypothetical protein
VCIICDCFIIGIETIHKLKIDQIAKHRERLSVKKYEEHYGQALKAEVVKQYQVNVEGLKNFFYHLDQGDIRMDLPLVHAVTRECHQIRQLRHRHPNLP